MKILVLLSFLFWGISCAGPAPNFSRIAVGMSKSEVVDQLGKPDSFSAVDNTERLTYGKWDDSDFDGRIGGGRYFVKLVNNQVTAFGKYGDPDGSPRPSIADLPPPPFIDLSPRQQYIPPAPVSSPVPLPIQRNRVFDVQPGTTRNSIEVRERTRFY